MKRKRVNCSIYLFTLQQKSRKISEDTVKKIKNYKTVILTALIVLVLIFSDVSQFES